MPRPNFQPTDEQRKRVKSLSALGYRHEDICLMIGLRSPKSLRKHFRQELSAGMAEANAAVAQIAYEMASSGRCLPLTIFYLKCNLKRPKPVEDDVLQKNWSVELHFLDKDGLPTGDPQVTHGKS